MVHHQPGILVGDQRVVDAHDVRVGELAGGAASLRKELTQQAAALRIGEDLAAQALDRHLDLAERVPGEMDAAGGALADAAEKSYLPMRSAAAVVMGVGSGSAVAEGRCGRGHRGAHLLGRGAADVLTRGQRAFDGEDAEDVLTEALSGAGTWAMAMRSSSRVNCGGSQP